MQKLKAMETLTEDQIKAIITWMNSWEQLRDTAIPIRFNEECKKRAKKSINKIILPIELYGLRAADGSEWKLIMNGYGTNWVEVRPINNK